MSSIPLPTLSPQSGVQYDPDDIVANDVESTFFLPKFEGRLPFRARPRRFMIVIFAAVFVTVFAPFLFLSDRSPLSEYVQLSQDPHSPASPQNGVTLTTPPVERPIEPVAFALIMYSEDSAKEAAVLIKSAIMYTSRPLEFHIICDDQALAYIDSRVRLVTHPVHPITVRFYPLTFQSMEARLQREGTLNTGHPSGIPGLMKLFLHEVLPDNVEKAIYVDTDAFLLTDPALLWEEFSRWGPDISVSIPYHPNLAIEEWYNASEICSCIMLLHLKKLRSVRLMDSSIYRADHSGLYPPALSPPAFEALFGPPAPHGFSHPALGDQAYWWAIVSNRKDIYEPLPYDWEVTSCMLDMYGTGLGDDDTTEDEERPRLFFLDDTPYKGQVVLPKLLHFNCLFDDPLYYNSEEWSKSEGSLSRRWGPAVQYHVGFKWIWLNRGYAESPVDIKVIVDPKFADERFAAEHVGESDPPVSPETERA